MNIRTCSDCRYEKEDASSEVCTNCHGIIKGEPSNWENKSCLVCVNFGKGVHVKPCKDCIYNKYKPSFELDKKENKEMEEIKTCSNCKHASDGLDDDICEQCSMEDRGGTVCYWEARNKTEGNNSDTKLIRCAVCKYRYKDMDAEPCNSCVNMGRGDKCKGEEVNCRECKYASVNINEEPCKNCSKNSRNSQIVSNLYFEPITAHCYDCKHISKGIDESPCNECCEVSMGDDCKWEGVYCEDCKYVEVDMDAEPCKNCSNNAWNCNKDKLTLNLHFEPKETESKQEVYNGVTPSCCTCKHFETNSNNEPCSKCVAICNGIGSYWEERDEETEPQTAREIVEKTVEQRLKEEHFDEHYHDKVQPLEIMQEIMTPEEFRGFLFGNIIKYSCRCGKKDEPQKEFAKLRRYREWYEKAILSEHIDPRV
jgi:hypothetical protein